MKEEIGRSFVEKTKYRNVGSSDQQKGLPQPPLEAPYDHSVPALELPRREDLRFPAVDLTEAIQKRQSLREYAPTPLAMRELCYLMMCTLGVRRVVPGVATFRVAPSAGARHALETYVLANRVEGLESGLYRFTAIERKVLPISTEAGLVEKFTEACLGQGFVRSCAALFLWVADVYRMTYRYGQRGYRYLYLDAGHVCQNLYLAAEVVGAGCCAIGAYDDDRVNELLGLDGKDQFAVYLAAVGKKPLPAGEQAEAGT
jgi:SagB-type dehydrogenase family enzyme